MNGAKSESIDHSNCPECIVLECKCAVGCSSVVVLHAGETGRAHVCKRVLFRIQCADAAQMRRCGRGRGEARVFVSESCFLAVSGHSYL